MQLDSWVGMAPLPEDPTLRATLATHVARLKHDLGKYVALQQQWLGPDPEQDALEEALAADLLSTRRGPDRTLDASEVWAEFRGALVGEQDLPGGGRVDLRADPDVSRLEQAMQVIAQTVSALRAGGLDADGVTVGHQAAMTVVSSCRSLHKRLRDPEVGWPIS